MVDSIFILHAYSNILLHISLSTSPMPQWLGPNKHIKHVPACKAGLVAKELLPASCHSLSACGMAGGDLLILLYLSPT